MTAVAAEPGTPAPSLRSRALRGTAWTVFAYASGSLIRLVSNFVLAQLFAPDVFGLLVIAGLVQQGLTMFSDLGVGLSIVRHRDGADPAFLNTAWTLQAIRGFLIWVAACALTWPVAAVYGRPELHAVIPVMGLLALIQGLNSTKLATARRDLDLSRLSALGVGESVLRFVVTIGWAVAAPSVWAIVGGNLIAAAAHTVATHALLRGVPNRLMWDRRAGVELLGFGRWIFVSTALTFFAMQTDKLLLGRLADPTAFGVYAVAFPFARLPQELAGVLVAAVLFPALASKARDSSDGLRTALETSRSVTLPVGLAATLGVALVAPWFFSLYRPVYADAKWMGPMLAAGFWFALLQTTSDRAIPVRGSARPLAIANVAALGVTVVVCWIGFRLAGLPGFIAGVAAGGLSSYLVVAAALATRGLPVFMRDLQYTGVLVASLALALGTPRLLTHLPGWWAPAVGALLSMTVLGAAGFFALRRVWSLVRPSRGTGTGAAEAAA